MVRKTSLIKSFFSGYKGENIQSVGRKRKKRSKQDKSATIKLKGYRKEETALIKRRKKINKIISDKRNLMPKYKSKPLKLNKI